MKMKGAEIVVECLVKHKVETVFGYPGGTVLHLYDALFKNSHRINHVITAHEQGACHAADGYARASGKVGVVIATSGPGATNLITGIATAFKDSVPLVAITGNVNSCLIGTNSFQEVDFVDMTQSVVKHSFRVQNIAHLEEALVKAFKIASSGRKGPVLVDVTNDVQCAEAPYQNLHSGIEPENFASCDLEEVVQAIKNSKRPLIYAGGGIVSAEAHSQLRQLAERLNTPVTLSAMGITALPHSHPLNLGFCGMHGSVTANSAQEHCDLMLAVGVRFSDRATGDTKLFLGDKTIVHIDIDHKEMQKNVATQINVCMEVKDALSQLLYKCQPKQNDDWLGQIDGFRKQEVQKDEESFTPKNILAMAAKHMGKDAVVATDVGQHQMWTLQYYPFEKTRTMLTSGGMGTMGYGLGAAIGGSIANNRAKTLLVTGDGSFSMNLNEMLTAVSQKLPIVVLIFNNSALGMVKQFQKLFFESRHYQTTTKLTTDFSLLAKAFGGDGYKASTLKELQAVLSQQITVPTVIDCQINQDEMVLPMIPPGKSFKDTIPNY